MFIVIFGQNECPYCIYAKILAKKLVKEKKFSYKFIDIKKKKISKNDLSKTIGKIINTVPQIFINKKYIGGFEDFKKYIKNNI
ncbi:GrxA family glutaredoxin [Sodalis-like secondary symbiont of Drepanosiphum platanoidis]|uniref:GrxA family glutaredoxin n=1 Tax=Sodalis-like secondary symbiont of Drepanosiphum platanoidis TaxID=2994493 RepID=UPI003463D816